MKTFAGATYKLTKGFIDALPYAERDASGRVQQQLFWDSRDKGFGLLVGLNRKSFVVQRAVKGKTVRLTIGRYGPHDFALDEARRVAQEELQKMRSGIDDRAKREAQKLTLAEAINGYERKLRHDKKSASTIRQYRYVLEKYLSDWLDRPLVEMTQKAIAERHAQLIHDIAAGKYAVHGRKPKNRRGEVTANQTFKIFGIVFKRAVDDDNQLTETPLKKVDWVRTATTHRAIPDKLLPVWYSGVNALANKVQADALLFMLFTGMRKQSVLEMKWEDVDLDARTLHVPLPKGGAKAAFDLPLSDYLITLLQRRKEQHPLVAGGRPECTPWVFPAPWGRTGHLTTVQPAIAGVDYVVHDLRRTFVTKAEALDISLFAIKGLVNHSLPRGDVTAKYVTHTVERLRAPMQAITNALLAICEGGATVTAMPRRA